MSGKAIYGRRATRKLAAQAAVARANGQPVPDSTSNNGSPEAAPVKRVAAYIRISTDELHQPFSLEAQEARLMSYISIQPGWEFAGIIYQDEKSGATLERPGLKKALAAAKAGKFDVLLVYRVDRLSRSLRGLVDILDQLSKSNVAFQSATEPVDTSSAVGRMLIQMLGVFAQFEREILIDRVINAMERKATKGEWCGGRVPHGYELNGDTKKLQNLAGEDLHIRTMFEVFTQQRLGTKEVAKVLNKRGFRTRSGKPWSGNGILAILRNRTYLGEVYFRGTWYRVDDHHPAIIDEKVFEKAQQILDGRSDDYSVRISSNSEYALSGGIKCVHCGAHYVGTAATGRAKRYRYYTCYTRARYGPDSCPAERLPAEEVEEKMTAALLDTYQQTGLIQEAISVIGAEIAEIGGKRDKEIATIDANLTEVTGKIDRYLQAFERGTMSDAAASERVTLLKEHQRELKAHRNQLDAEPIPEPAAEVTADDLASLREEIKGLVTNGASGVRNALFRALVDEIQVTGRHKIKPYFRVPLNNGTPGTGPGVRIMTEWAPLLGRKLNPSLVRHLEKYCDLAPDEPLLADPPPSAYVCPQRRGLSTRLSDGDVSDLVLAFENGQSRPALARRYGISVSSVARILKRYRAGQALYQAPETYPAFRKSDAKILRSSRG